MLAVVPSEGRVGAVVPAAKPGLSSLHVSKLQEISQKMFPLSRTPYFHRNKLFAQSDAPSAAASSSAAPKRWIEQALDDARKLMLPSSDTTSVKVQHIAFLLFYFHHVLQTGTPPEGKGKRYLAGMPKSGGGSASFPGSMKAICNWLKFPEYAPTDLPALSALQLRAP